jgi:hypothetical protein
MLCRERAHRLLRSRQDSQYGPKDDVKTGQTNRCAARSRTTADALSVASGLRSASALGSRAEAHAELHDQLRHMTRTQRRILLLSVEGAYAGLFLLEGAR